MRQLFFIIISISVSLGLRAQDPIFSQFNFNKLYINPAFAGYNGGLFVSGNNHNHLVDVPGDFRTLSVSADMQIPCNNIGIGFIGTNHKEGQISLLTNSFGIMASYIKLLKETNTRSSHHISAGLSLRYVQTRLDLSQAIFSSQLDNVDGVLGTAPNTDITREQVSYLDNDFGVVYNFNKYNRETHTVSLSASHIGFLTNPDESIQNRSVRRPFKTTLYYSFYKPYSIGKNTWGFSPHFLIQNQNKLNHFTFGSYLFGNTKNSRVQGNGVFIGLFYRNSPYPNFKDANSLLVTIGLGGLNLSNNNGGKVSFAYSLDIPNRGLNLGTSHEFSIRFHFEEYTPFCKGSGRRLMDCNNFIQ
jgi:type IX secretion system PorP/SprF family membrane protein